MNDVRSNAPEINWDYAVIQRISDQDLSTELMPFNLGKAVLEHQDASNLPLEPGDIVTIFSQADLRVPREQQTKLVRLEGEFASSGIYRAQAGENLRDLVAEPAAWRRRLICTARCLRASPRVSSSRSGWTW